MRDEHFRIEAARAAGARHLATGAAAALVLGLVACGLAVALAPAGRPPVAPGLAAQVLAVLAGGAVLVALVASLTGLALTRLRSGRFCVLLLLAAAFAARLLFDS